MGFLPRVETGFTAAAVVLLLALGSQIVTAADPLDPARRLREQGEYDKALKILRVLSIDMSQDKDVRAVLDYEIGLTLVDKARTLRDATSRQSVLAEAEAALQRFVSMHGTHPFVTSAMSQMGNILVEKAKMEVERSKTSATPEEGERDLAAASAYYDQARRLFVSHLKKTKTALERIGPLDPATQREEIEFRDRLRMEYLQSKLLIPAIKEEQADTFSKASDQRHELLRSAADEFREVHQNYRTRVAGLYALMYQGRCYLKLEEHEKALECFDALFDQPDAPDVFKQLKLKSALLAADCWLDPRRKNYERAIGVMQRIVDNSVAGELRQPDWLWLRVKLARAYQRRADQLAKAEDASAVDDNERKQSLSHALEHARAAAQIPGEHADEARAIVNEITKMSPPKDLDETNSEREAQESDCRIEPET